ncbi:hypothetical protein BGX28_005913 [Mortierella sp. GBA30]|nr:hypothetical protein BGX28_005913 [Mortierella sp. GBA30]
MASPVVHRKSTSHLHSHLHSHFSSYCSTSTANDPLLSPRKDPAHLSTASSSAFTSDLKTSTTAPHPLGLHSAINNYPTLIPNSTEDSPSTIASSLLSSSSSSVLYPLDPDPNLARQTTSPVRNKSDSALLSIAHRQQEQKQELQQESSVLPQFMSLPHHSSFGCFLLNASSFSLSSSSSKSLTSPLETVPVLQNPTTPAAEIPNFASPSSSYFLADYPSFSSASSSLLNASSADFPCSTGSCTASSIPSAMPPTTHYRQSSANLGASHQWEPYPSPSKAAASNERKGHRPSYSLCNQFSPSALSSLRLPPTSAPTLLCSTPSDTPAGSDLNIEEMSCNTVSELLDQALSDCGDRYAILILDMRPAVCYAASSIVTAISVSVPNMLLKRPMYSLDMVTEQLTTEREVYAFSNWRRFSNIVFFDATGAVPTKGSPIYCIAQKFRREGFEARLGYIRGGYNAFFPEHRSQCCVDNVSPLSSTSGRDSKVLQPSVSTLTSTPDETMSEPLAVASPARCRLHLGSLPAMMTRPIAGDTIACETPMMENANVNPLFESVRQAMGLNTNITEEVAVRLPAGFSMETVQKDLPDWLVKAVCEGTGKASLAEDFQRVEIGEKRRLALLMCPQQMRSGRTADFSIGAGIEKGLKNRYNNVWPFDHSRVKIQEPEEDGADDYINASFLKSPINQKSYIATQGPLPSTFLDFWKVVWEQKSRVIVMLTREMEMGRIKCHQYWPTELHPVMDLGPIRLTFLNEYRSSTVVDGTVLIRQMRLKHLRHSLEPERTITQIQYTGWPDFGVPDTPLDVLKIVELANKYNRDPSATTTASGPMVVHCSAGCGRTGAFCVIDSVLSKLNSLELDDGNSESEKRIRRHSVLKEATTDVVFATVSAFREQRLSMVQCLRQYVFCYEAILWHLAYDLMEERPATYERASSPQVSSASKALCEGNAPVLPTNEEFSFFG